MQVSVFSIRIDPAFLELDQQKLNAFLETVAFKNLAHNFWKVNQRIGLLLFIMKKKSRKNPND